MNLTDATIIQLGNNIDMELVRVAGTAGGIDGMIFRMSVTVHVPGVQWDGTVTSNPTDAELATGTSWTKVEPDDRGIQLVKYLSK